MRMYCDKKDTSKKNYYKDRFFKTNETKKLDPIETIFKEEINILSKFNLF